MSEYRDGDCGICKQLNELAEHTSHQEPSLEVERALAKRDQEWLSSIDLALQFLLSEPGPIDRGTLVYELRAAAERLGARRVV